MYIDIQTLRSVIYTLVALNIGTGSCKPTPPGGQEYTTDGAVPASKSTLIINKNRSTRSTSGIHADRDVIPTSTENMSTEMTTLSADDIGINSLEKFKRQAENLGMATNTLFNALRSSEESTQYLASLSNYPSIPNDVREHVKNCTHMQETFMGLFTLTYSYARRYRPVLEYINHTYRGQRSLVKGAHIIDTIIWSLMLDISVFVIPVEVTDAPGPSVEFITVMETLATLNIQCTVMAEIFQDLKQCSTF